MSGDCAAASRMRGKVCLVTGGGSGIGRATALRMAAEGAEACCRGPARGRIEDTAAACRELGAKPSRSRPTSRERTTSSAWFARRSSAAAGSMSPSTMPDSRSAARRWKSRARSLRQVFDTNVRALFLCLRHQLPVMLARKAGSIVVNASVSGVRNPNPGFSLYSASKAAAISLTRSAAMENAPRGIRINAIAPGRVVTDMMLRAGVGDCRPSRRACRCGGWGARRKSPRRWCGCRPTRRRMSSATCWRRTGDFWRRS